MFKNIFIGITCRHIRHDVGGNALLSGMCTMTGKNLGIGAPIHAGGGRGTVGTVRVSMTISWIAVMRSSVRVEGDHAFRSVITTLTRGTQCIAASVMYHMQRKLNVSYQLICM